MMRKIALAWLLFAALSAPAAAGQLTGGLGPPCAAFGTSVGTCAQGNDSRITGAVQSGGALGTPSSGNLQNTNAVTKLGQQTVPLVLVSSGTMGNNGALSAITAVATAYPSAYCYLPAGAIAAASTAGWYFCQFSGTTAATIFNNTYTSGTPCIPATSCNPAPLTPFVTTGPGAYTQTTGSNIASYTLAIAGNTIGLNGTVRIIGSRTNNNSAGNKTFTAAYDTYTIGSQVATTAVTNGLFGGFSNRAATNVQVAFDVAGFGLTSTPIAIGSIDSTATKNLVVNLQLATATDTMTLESAVVELLPGVP